MEKATCQTVIKQMGTSKATSRSSDFPCFRISRTLRVIASGMKKTNRLGPRLISGWYQV
jgi:hypothetical protein